MIIFRPGGIYKILVYYIMPYRTRKMPGRNCYKVYNAKTKKVFAKCTTASKAKKQLRLLRAIENNPGFVVNGARSSRRRRQK